MSCARLLAQIDAVLSRAGWTLQQKAVAAFLILHPMRAAELAKHLDISRSAAFSLMRAVAELIEPTPAVQPAGLGVQPAGLLGRNESNPLDSESSPLDLTDTERVQPAGLWPAKNGGNPPIPEPGPRARVDSSSSSKKEESKKGRERAKALSTRAGARENEPPGFAEFYLAYPRKVGRPSAVKAFTKAIKAGATLEQILAGLRRYRFSSDQEFIPHPATWLNDERWNVAPPPTPAKNQFPTRLPPRDQDPMMGMVRL